MLLSNLEIVPGRKITKHLGLVQGSTVRSKHIGRDIMAGFKNVLGGELTGYTELLQESREEATQRMVAEAIGANVVLNIRFSTSSISQGATGKIASKSCARWHNRMAGRWTGRRCRYQMLFRCWFASELAGC